MMTDDVKVNIKYVVEIKPDKKKPSFDAFFFANGRGKAKCPPDPRFPKGIVIDMARDQIGCLANLEYPAPECGLWVIKCRLCGMSVGVTAAGRIDDPHTVIVPCKDKKHGN